MASLMATKEEALQTPDMPIYRAGTLKQYSNYDICGVTTLHTSSTESLG